MFISQVVFSGQKENEETLIQIMKKKTASMKDVEGLISSECWRKEDKEEVGYALTTKWENKEHFKVWLAKDHGKGHGGKQPENQGQNRPEIKKAGSQYELVEF